MVVVEPPGIEVLVASGRGDRVLVVAAAEHMHATRGAPQPPLVSHCSSGLSTVSPQTPGTGGASVTTDFFIRSRRRSARERGAPTDDLFPETQGERDVAIAGEAALHEHLIAPGNGGAARPVGPRRVALLTRSCRH